MNKKVLLAILAISIAMLACGSSAPKAKTADEYIKEYGGSATVYQTILALTDCAELQNQFNTASGNNAREQAGSTNFKATLGYMTAADERMKELGCY